MHGAHVAGWETRRFNIGDIPLGTVDALGRGEAPDADICGILSDIEWANRLAIIFPLWFDRPPEALRILFAQSEAPRRAQVIITMDMPAFAYRSLLRPGGSKKAPALDIPGVVPDEPVLIGCVSSITAQQRRQWIETVRDYGKSWLGASDAPHWTFATMFDRAVGHLRH